ncbi:uncharacterized protein EV422DRAFT_503232 [Fimicolochytrium jonesii]|uniref:uncharacterized protein n=1 Tax=Fimicolochytrium jonesii TaxID=1396493 RepID=UPI0022FF2672|nr:uncharacterized protein EV422DRAFT_503232 [Fimicolochytrium jonesii]KAI8825873.1 hypothetical protein EV422DRAFT_503232 [Fimicolochytrium jonesii]
MNRVHAHGPVPGGRRGGEEVVVLGHIGRERVLHGATATAGAMFTFVASGSGSRERSGGWAFGQRVRLGSGQGGGGNGEATVAFGGGLLRLELVRRRHDIDSKSNWYLLRCLYRCRPKLYESIRRRNANGESSLNGRGLYDCAVLCLGAGMVIGVRKGFLVQPSFAGGNFVVEVGGGGRGRGPRVTANCVPKGKRRDQIVLSIAAVLLLLLVGRVFRTWGAIAGRESGRDH